MNKKGYARKILAAMLAFGFLTVPVLAHDYYEEEEVVVTAPVVANDDEEEDDEEEEVEAAAVAPAAPTVAAAPLLDEDFPEELLELSVSQLRIRLIQRRITQAQFNAIMRARMSVILGTEGALVPAEAPVIEENDEEYEEVAEEDYYEEEEGENEE